MRRTKDELGELLQTRMPRIVERADRRTFAQCLKLRDLVANRADSETLEREFRALQPKLPFARIKPKMMSTGFSIAFDQNMEQSKREQHLKALEEEMIFLSSLSDQPSLTRYAWRGGSDILGMNAGLSYHLTSRYDDTLNYISTIVEASIYAISEHWRSDVELQHMDEDFLQELSGHVDRNFSQLELPVEYRLETPTNLLIPKPLGWAVGSLLAMHVRRTDRVIFVGQQGDRVEFSCSIERSHWKWGENAQAKDLPHYHSAVDASKFLHYLVSALPDEVSFRVAQGSGIENDRAVFSLRGVPEVAINQESIRKS